MVLRPPPPASTRRQPDRCGNGFDLPTQQPRGHAQALPLDLRRMIDDGRLVTADQVLAIGAVAREIAKPGLAAVEYRHGRCPLLHISDRAGRERGRMRTTP